jgi:2-keto-4-pentenoate hydratase
MSKPLDDERIARGMRTQLARRAARIADGDTAIGWKVGFGAPAALKTFGLTAPLVGAVCARVTALRHSHPGSASCTGQDGWLSSIIATPPRAG